MSSTVSSTRPPPRSTGREVFGCLRRLYLLLSMTILPTRRRATRRINAAIWPRRRRTRAARPRRGGIVSRRRWHRRCLGPSTRLHRRPRLSAARLAHRLAASRHFSSPRSRRGLRERTSRMRCATGMDPPPAKPRRRVRGALVVIFSSRVQLGKGGRNPTTRKKTNQAAHRSKKW